MANITCLLKILEHCQIGPAATICQVSTASDFPLTFFDIPYSGTLCGNRLFFYEFPYPTHHFIETILPTLKHSLSLTLQHFYPLAGNLLCPPPPREPYIHCTNNDTVTLTIAESTANFRNIISKPPQRQVIIDLKEVAPFIPKMPPITCTNNDSTLVFPIIVLQVTVFPNNGLCIGITIRHVIDGRSSSHFMKSWASINSQVFTGNCLTTNFLDEKSLPVFDREVIKNPVGVKDTFFRDYFQWRKTWSEALIGKTTDDYYAKPNHENAAKVTFLLNQEKIELLKTWMSDKWEKITQEDSPPYLSKFVVTCAFMWVCFLKLKHNKNEEAEEYFYFSAEYRNLLEYPIPITYIGNCISLNWVVAKRKELMEAEKGIVTAAKTIQERISKIKKNPLHGVEGWTEVMNNFNARLGRKTLFVIGSPNFGAYETDFGFGRPKKAENVPVLYSMSLVESANEGDCGIEVGLVVKRAEMEDLISIFERQLAGIN